MAGDMQSSDDRVPMRFRRGLQLLQQQTMLEHQLVLQRWCLGLRLLGGQEPQLVEWRVQRL